MKDKKKTILKEAEGLLKKLNVEAKCNVKETEGVFVLDIVPVGDPALLIGYHAEVLGAIQRMLQVILYQIFDEKVELLVDINGYRLRQKERLEKIAGNIAERVRTEKREASLSSFSPYERKVIHSFISDNFDDLETKSEGIGRLRKLIVKIKK